MTGEVRRADLEQMESKGHKDIVKNRSKFFIAISRDQSIRANGNTVFARKGIQQHFTNL